LPAVYRLALYEAAGEGFAVMSGFAYGITPIRGNYSPDKEFRYLRTVIVTAAVYRGFSSELRPYGLTLPINLPAPGRRHSVYIALRLGTLLCF